MNKKLREFLQSLDDKDADDIWDYLDGDRYCRQEMIEVIIESHPQLNEPFFGYE